MVNMQTNPKYAQSPRPRKCSDLGVERKKKTRDEKPANRMKLLKMIRDNCPEGKMISTVFC